jgi:hypothetical protein
METRKPNNDKQILLPLQLSLPGRDIDETMIDVPANFENIEDYDFMAEENEGILLVEMDDDEEVDNESTLSGTKKNLIECSASVILPFSEDVAFDAFSDLTRQP